MMKFSAKTHCLLAVKALFLCVSTIQASADLDNNDRHTIRAIRKRIDEHGEITNEAENGEEVGRKYLEGLWDKVEKNYERRLEGGRMPYLESMMRMLSMSMSLPSNAPNKAPSGKPDTPGVPTRNPVPSIPTASDSPVMVKPVSPSPPTIPPRGPTLPTREPIPTRAPIAAPSPDEPVEVPTIPTRPTTFSPTRPCIEAEKENFLLETLSTITETSKLLDTDTPQGMAYSFLLEEEPSFVCSRTLMQRYGLSTLYFATEGTSWTDNSNWLEDEQECEWYGVDCDDRMLVTSLNLAVNNLNGMVPDEISVLTAMQKIDLFFNSISGKLPGGLAGLISLTSLDFQQNLLTGEAFPTSVTNLPQLVSYRISNNQFTGEVPAQIGSLRNLKELWAGNNKITGSISSAIGDLRNLKTIIFNDNELLGMIPSELGLIPLEALVLNNNQFLDTIPSQLFNVASLNTIRLDNNFLEGTLPAAIGQLTDLENFRVENNKLSGQIPKSIGSMTSLVNLRLNDNSWTGTVPDVFENYKQLDFFDISNSNLAGTIPKTIFSIPTLRLAYMSNCNLNGTIPLQYADPPDLRDLYLNGNNITGTVPSINAGQLEKLSEFLLQDTRITGTMPDSICNLRSDYILDDLWTDCGGESPEIECDYPQCCNRCFEAKTISDTRKKKRQLEAVNMLTEEKPIRFERSDLS